MLAARGFSWFCLFLLSAALCPSLDAAAETSRLPKVLAGQSVMMIIQPSGSVLVFAHENKSGQLGQGTLGVPEFSDDGLLLPGVTDAVDGAVGGGSFLLLRADGTVLAWGDNHSGQLGLGIVPSAWEYPKPVPRPTRVPGLAHVRQLAMPEEGGYAMALLDNGTVLTWGASFSDGFGLGMPIPKNPESHNGAYLWRPQAIPGLAGVKAISAGGGFALALLENGTIKAWGRNKDGEIGDEVISGSTVPVTVPGIDSAVAISAGLDYALAIMRDGTVRVWGSGAFEGVHFAGSRSPSIHTDTDAHWTAKPVAIPGLRNAVAIATGTSALALLADGTVRAWGWNGGASMGLGNQLEYPKGLQTPHVSSVAAIATGYNRSYFILRDGSILAAGSHPKSGLFRSPTRIFPKNAAKNP
ncbi:MAG: hypothetical protein LAN84_14795 [Acidobacteriia bacterium]|nr:hypothetical protein [Terriglobia bacterium]